MGIGTSNPQNKLDVCGTIRSQEWIVETGWCDFVFEDDYPLMSLYELEQYLKKNKHLPDIPTATEIENDGLHVGDMNVKMMQKIEELYLYVIELKKENEELKKRLTNLEVK